MRNRLLSISVFLLFSCSSQEVVNDSEISDLIDRDVATKNLNLSPKELAIHQCFQKGKNECAIKFANDDGANLENFHYCVLDEGIDCSYENYEEDHVKKLNKLKALYRTTRNPRYLNWIRLANSNTTQLLNQSFELSMLSNYFSNSDKKLEAISVDEKDFNGDISNLNGIALKKDDRLSFYCRNQFQNEQKNKKRLYYKGSKCEDSMDLSGNKILIKFQNNEEMIVDLDYLKLKEEFQAINSSTRSEIASDISKMIQNDEFDLSTLVAAVLFNVDIEKRKITLKNIETKRKFASLSKNVNYAISTVSENLKSCFMYSSEERLSLKDSTLANVNFFKFGDVDTSLVKSLRDNTGLELLNPFLLNLQQLDFYLNLVRKENFDLTRIQSMCSEKTVKKLGKFN